MENSKKPTNKSCLVFGIIIGGGLLIFALAAGYYFLFYSPSNAQPDELVGSGGPDLMFISPSPGTMAEVGDSLLAHVTANDIAGVSRIDLWIDGTLALSQPSPEEAGVSPLSLYHGLNALKPGNYTLVARAYNTRGAMSESPAINVKIIEAQEGDADDDSLQYVVQEGDTLEKIAKNSGNSVANIQAANPGLKNVQQSQIIEIKHMMPQKKPLTIDAILGLQPQAPPAGLQELAAGQAGQLLPSIAPDFGVLMEQNPSPIKMPDGLAAKVDGCKVTVSWNDRSDNETGFGIYRRSPNQASSHLIEAVGINKESYVDEVPYPATYEYAVEAVNFPQGQNVNAGLQVRDAARSQPLQVKVEPSAKCIKNPQSFKTVKIQIADAYPKSDDILYTTVWFSINDGPPRRQPGFFRTDPNSKAAKWGDDGSTYIRDFPLPTSVRLNPDQPIIVKIWAAGHTEAGWKDQNMGPGNLGVAFTSHQVNDILSVPKLFEVNGTDFKAKYWIMVEDMKWDADLDDATCSFLSEPTNFRVDPSVSNTRRLAWDYTNVVPCDFILYRSYSCVGQETRIEAPVFISSEKRSYDLDFRYEPLGCAYRYEIAAVSECGQSKRSNAVVGNTEAGLSALWVTFKELRVDKMPNPPIAQIVMRAGYQDRKSDIMWLPPGVHELDKLFLNGKKPNNQAYMALADKQSLDIFFAVSGRDTNGNISMGSLCMGTFTPPPLNTWKGEERTDTILSANGNCELTIEWKLQPPTPSSSGSTALPQADLVVDKIANIGGEYYARISNNGPDQLPGNQTSLHMSWGEQCLLARRVWGPYYTMKYWVGFNTPVWVYLGDSFSQELSRAWDDIDSFVYKEHPCDFHLFTHIMPFDNSSVSRTPFYIDPVDDNQWFSVAPKDVLPMQ